MKKRIIAAAVLTAMTMTTGASVFAETTSEEDTITSSQAGCVVTVHQNSEFTVTLPKTITLDNIENGIANEDYTVTVKGDIAGNEIVTVTPVASFDMIEDAGKKANVSVTVAQEKANFIFSDISGEEGVSTTGHLTSQKLTAGDWTGTMSFTIAKSVISEPGLYDAGWNKLRALTIDDVEKDYASSSSIAASLGVDPSKVTRIVIPEGATRIGNNAFVGCTKLTSITIPDSVTSIGNGAFTGCESLTSITLPNNVTSIENQAFLACGKLTNITFPSSVESIGNYAFSRCTSLASITLSNGVTSIGNNAFEYCSNLTSITIPSSVASIGNSAFVNCSGLTSITLSNGVTSIGDNAFAACSGLTSITIPSSVTSIGQAAFGGTNLSNATFKTTSDWYVGSSAGAKTTELSDSDLADASTAATYLTGIHCSDYWSR